MFVDIQTFLFYVNEKFQTNNISQKIILLNVVSKPSR